MFVSINKRFFDGILFLTFAETKAGKENLHAAKNQ